MKRLELIPVALLGALASFMIVQMNASPLASQSPAVTPTVTSDAGAVDSTEVAPLPRVSVRVPAVSRDVDDIRTRLAMGEAGTYIGEILASRDSSLARWRDRSIEPLRVWVDIAPPLDAWRREFAEHAREAFEAWSDVGIPVRFTFVVDPAQSDVQVTWVDRFDEQISGKTHWARDENWWITDGSIVLALHHRDGHALDTAAIRAIALHEVGHLLGLDHTADETSIMTPKVRVRDLSNADRATARLIYSLPAGSVR
ncbi:MAG TPA: matrixin family metalloprotease [Gemmatimonadaceae bacterium]|nr:matrixin family metalloprotease [Gemmatimonadaceae bacterium]